MKCKLGVAGLCVLAGVLVLCNQPSTTAQGKKDDPAKQIQQLKKQLAEKEQHIQKLEMQIQKLKGNDAKDDAKIAQLEKRVKQLEAELKGKKGEKTSAQWKKELDAARLTIQDRDLVIAALQDKSDKSISDLSKEVVRLRKVARDFETVKKAPFVHSKILKLKKSDDEQVKLVADEVGKTLAKIEGVRGVWLGKPAELGTPELAQKGYQLGVVVLLDDELALQKFLDDPLHKQFADRMGSLWERPLVYDIQREAEEKKK